MSVPHPVPHKPQFADTVSWQQADQLMQPALIRTIDNLRKYFEGETPWQGDYREFAIWPDNVPEETQAQIALLQQELKSATPEQVDAIEDALAQMPQPTPGYELVLKRTGRAEPIVRNLMALCYQVCFVNAAEVIAGTAPAQVDQTLLEADTAEVDWSSLDQKTRSVVEQLFAELG
ncbi:MAG: hypothetical protein RLZZ511_1390 [Cyanobacteriota bacterium]|jgi:hypothetical protein